MGKPSGIGAVWHAQWMIGHQAARFAHEVATLRPNCLYSRPGRKVPKEIDEELGEKLRCLYGSLSNWYAHLAGLESKDGFFDLLDQIWEINDLVLPYIGSSLFDAIQQCDDQDEGESTSQDKGDGGSGNRDSVHLRSIGT